MLIVGLKVDPLSVSRQLGHRSTTVTLNTYAHMFEQAKAADDMRHRLDTGFGHLFSTEVESAPKQARDPLKFTWELAPGSSIRLTWVKPHRGFPAVFMSFIFVDKPGKRHCLMKRARRANEPSSS